METVVTRKAEIYGLVIQAGFTGAFQNILYRPGDGMMTNLTQCDVGTTSTPAQIMYFNSSRLEALGFISSLVIHNGDTKTASAGRLRFYDAATGANLGTVGLATIAPHAEIVGDANAFETADPNGPVAPPESRTNYNLVWEESQITGRMQHFLNNTNTFINSDLTTVCTLAP